MVDVLPRGPCINQPRGGSLSWGTQRLLRRAREAGGYSVLHRYLRLPWAGAGPGPGKLDHGVEIAHPESEIQTERGGDRGRGERQRYRWVEREIQGEGARARERERETGRGRESRSVGERKKYRERERDRGSKKQRGGVRREQGRSSRITSLEEMTQDRLQPASLIKPVGTGTMLRR